MKKSFTAIVFLSITLFWACHKKEMSKTVPQKITASAAANVNSTSPIKDPIIDASIDITNTGAAYNIDSMKISGDILSVFVTYSGGCKEHSFELYSNGMYAKSLPPQLSLCLRHSSNDDACRELINQELKYTISKLKYPGNNTVILKLGAKQRITYTVKPI